MPEFRYSARNAQGQLVDGTVTASDRSAAIAMVEQKRYVPIRVQPAEAGGAQASLAAPLPQQKSSAEGAKDTSSSKAALAKTGDAAAKSPASRAGSATASAAAPAGRGMKLSYAQQYLFSEQLAHLLNAGMTLDESLGVLVKRLKHPKLQAISKSLHQSLVDGRSLSQAMRDFPRIFSPLYVNMVSSGEASGSLPIILRRLTIHIGEVKALRDSVQQALLYPAVLVVIGVALIMIFMNTMVPQLISFFKDAGTTLPGPTLVIINLNNTITRYWWLILALMAGAFVLFRAFVASPSGRVTWGRFKWTVPVLSRIPRYRLYAQFARTLATLTQNGVTLLRALELLEDIAGNEFIRLRMEQVRASVVDGATLSNALAQQNIFPEMFVDMMGVGEQTGKFPDTMNLIADVYERELDKQVKIVSTLIPPIVMVLIAAVIGTVIYGILIAVFKLTGGLHRR
ncbi:MAG: type II secretion system F family protein [Chthoniobacteraceae bacterium]